MIKQNVIAELVPASTHKIGVLKLNSEASLNSLDLPMVEYLYNTLCQWEQNDSVSCVFLHAEGEKAFCAGGDVQQLYQSAVSQPGGPCEYAEQFFCSEYRLNYLMHTYAKPIICWGNGIVMGGGLGLLAGASHRIGTPSTRIAMPEITIGLFPDVGGSWILNRLAHNLGYFLALTGAPLNLLDALECGEVDWAIVGTTKQEVLDRLTRITWSESPESNNELINQLMSVLSSTLIDLETTHNLQSQTAPYREIINKLFGKTDLSTIIKDINQIHGDDLWINQAKQTLSAGSPLSARLIFEQLRRSRDLPLEEVFQSELLLATNIVRFPEFTEGVRALLIDKDKNPQWTYRTIEDIPSGAVNSFFYKPWDTNPLARISARRI